MLDDVIQGDCLTVMNRHRANYFDLIMTSPPYAGKRENRIQASEYVEWFMARSDHFKLVLKPTGSFILNIKEGAIDGQRQLYAMDLVLALVREQGWLFVEEYIWHKTNAAPGKWPNRFRDAWEHCYHFTKQKHFAMYQDEVKVPIGGWAPRRLKNLSKNDMERRSSATGSGVGRKVANWADRRMVYPSNILRLSGEASNRNHNAAFPEALPSWFIRLFTKPGDVVLDPFVGSGTTAAAAKRLGRHYVGIDISEENCAIAAARLSEITACQPSFDFI